MHDAFERAKRGLPQGGLERITPENPGGVHPEDEPTIGVRFQRQHDVYGPGEVAYFPRSVADQLVGGGAAVLDKALDAPPADKMRRRGATK